jgi:hypothetical protein
MRKNIGCGISGLKLLTSQELVYGFLWFNNTRRFVNDVLKKNMQEIIFQKEMHGGPIIHFT